MTDALINAPSKQLNDNRDEVLEAHRTWLTTHGRRGRAASFENANLDGQDLRGCDLRQARLSGASLRGTDLSGAQLAGASLREVDLIETRGLSASQLAGTDLTGARLPVHLASFDGLVHAQHLSRNGRTLLMAIAVSCAYVWLTVLTTSDAQILTSDTLAPLPIIGTKIPIAGFIVFVPFLLLGAYVYLHLQLVRLWKAIVELPAYFPDGKPLADKVYPWPLNAVALAKLSPAYRVSRFMSLVERALSVFLLWIFLPLVLALLWLRYLPRHDWFGTNVHVALLGVATFFAVWSRLISISIIRGRSRQPSIAFPVLCGVAIALLGWIVSFGAINGIREDIERAIAVAEPPFEITDAETTLRVSVPRALESLPYGARAFAYLDTENLSNWSATDVQFTSSGVPCGLGREGPQRIVGAQLRGVDLRYASARESFLACADLRRAKLRGINLVGAQLQGALLAGASLQKAYLFRAQMRGARLQEATLEGAYLADAALTGAILRFARLKGIVAVGTQFADADLLGADLEEALLSGANLKGANMSQTRLYRTSLDGADLTDARNLRQEQIDEACISNETKLPAGITRPHSNPCLQTTSVPSVIPACSPLPCTIQLKSDASTLAIPIGRPGEPNEDERRQLDSAPPANTPFSSAKIGRFYTSTPLPVGSFEGTQVVNIPPGDGRSGYLKVVFMAPTDFSTVVLEGSANVDDTGRMFINGYPISPSLACVSCPDRIKQFASQRVISKDVSHFRRGQANELVLSVANVGGGPSGAAFAVAITFDK